MEDDRKGTWEDVTEDCTLDWWTNSWNNSRGHIDVNHNGHRVAIVGHQVNTDVGSVWEQRGEYRVTTAPDGRHSGTIKVEHFIPDPEPEWVDVTYECEVEWKRTGNIYLWHKGVAVAIVAHRVNTAMGRNAENYRVTTQDGGNLSGRIKVEKRND